MPGGSYWYPTPKPKEPDPASKPLTSKDKQQRPSKANGKHTSSNGKRPSVKQLCAMFDKQPPHKGRQRVPSKVDKQHLSGKSKQPSGTQPHGKRLSVKGKQLLAKGKRLSIKGKQLLAKGNRLLVKGISFERLSFKGKQLLAEGKRLSVRGKQLLAKGKRLSVKDKQPSAQDKQPSAQDKLPSAQGKQASDKPPPSKSPNSGFEDVLDFILSGTDKPSSDEHLSDKRPPAQDKQPPSQAKQPPAQDKQPPTQAKQPPAQDKQPPTQDKQPPAQDKQPPTQDKQPPAQDKQLYKQPSDHLLPSADTVAEYHAHDFILPSAETVAEYQSNTVKTQFPWQEIEVKCTDGHWYRALLLDYDESEKECEIYFLNSASNHKVHPDLLIRSIELEANQPTEHYADEELVEIYNAMYVCPTLI